MTPGQTPLLSVVIPTHRRPQWLPRAIDSALQAAPAGDTEVIVVPNGPDESWKMVARRYEREPRIQWRPVALGHANVARNHGMRNASGKYIRFLDDDDYLLAPAASQIDLLERTCGDVCSGLVENIDQNGVNLGTLKLPSFDDFICASTSISGFTLPVGNVFRSSILRGFLWDESADWSQDNIWMMTLSMGREWSWIHLQEHVGVWFQHDDFRISTVHTGKHDPTKVIETMLLLYNTLRREDRLTDVRTRTIASALLGQAHRHFPKAPIYWHGITAQALEIHPKAVPDHPVFTNTLLEHLDFLTIEWIGLPFRKISRLARDVRGKIFGWDYRRRL
jgi:glycosyltransferase involved in cell wall biosynthesis